MRLSVPEWKVRVAWLLVAVCFALPSSTSRAQEVARLCGVPVTPSPEFEREVLKDQTYPDFVAGRPQAATNRLADAYEQSLRPEERVTQQVQTFLRHLRAPTSRQSSLWEISRDDDTGDAILFERDTTGSKATIPCRPGPVPAYAHDMVAIAGYVGIALAAQEDKDKKALWLAVKKQATDHEDLIRNGLPMWPWELWLNGKRLGKSDADPLFKTQVVFLRPSAGVEINTRSRERANLEGSLLLEPIGFVRYVDDSRYAKWWGVSAVVTTSTGQGMGYGALFRYGRYSAGLTLHKSEVEGISNDVHLVFGMDLYDLVEKKRDELPAVRNGIKESFDNLLK
ncbi:MAG: hypothetical protein HY067_13765 [Betaproteobacteria bacterium]|nr:hypothetical protein [Betaproteobacteria bacterium]